MTTRPNPPIKIEHLEDVLPHIRLDDGLSFVRRDGYSILDYIYVTETTFTNPLALECRGLKFGADGRLLARPFHKFFNLGEKERPHEVDWSRPHTVFEKLDGSMVHPARLNGATVFMTRKGLSEQAVSAWNVAGENVRRMAEDLILSGLTPMFEFTSPNNHIVVPYNDERLTLLAIRETVSGRYYSHAELMEAARSFRVATPEVYNMMGDADALIGRARTLEGKEGYVVAFDDGHRLKIKADAYVLRHKALSQSVLEKNVLNWIATGAIDDVLPLLPNIVRAKIVDYQRRLFGCLETHCRVVDAFVREHEEAPRRNFAAAVQTELHPRLRQAAFAKLDGKDTRAFFLKLLEWAAGSQTRIDGLRDLFPIVWQSSELPEIELG